MNHSEIDLSLLWCSTICLEWFNVRQPQTFDSIWIHGWSSNEGALREKGWRLGTRNGSQLRGVSHHPRHRCWPPASSQFPPASQAILQMSARTLTGSYIYISTNKGEKAIQNWWWCFLRSWFVSTSGLLMWRQRHKINCSGLKLWRFEWICGWSYVWCAW